VAVFRSRPVLSVRDGQGPWPLVLEFQGHPLGLREGCPGQHLEPDGQILLFQDDGISPDVRRPLVGGAIPATRAITNREKVGVMASLRVSG
jgi:hypothetical protein